MFWDMFANQATVLPTIFKIPAYLFMILLLPSFWGRLLPTWVPGHPSTYWCHARHILLATTYCQLNQLSAEEDELIRSLRQVKEQYSHILSLIPYPNESVLTSGISKRKKIFIWNFFYDMWKTHKAWKSKLEALFHSVLAFPMNRSFDVRRFFKRCFFACLLDMVKELYCVVLGNFWFPQQMKHIIWSASWFLFLVCTSRKANISHNSISESLLNLQS